MIPVLAPGPRLPAPFATKPYVPTLPLTPTANATGEVKFPDGFLLGAATAAAQIEGAAFEDGKEASIWDTFCRVPGAVYQGDTIDVACDHYHRMPQDVALMKELNLDAYRFSTSWARIQPGGRGFNAKGLDFYSRLVDELLANDILPWLTLYHWDLPQAIQDEGGWPARDTAYRFADYALAVHDKLGDRVRAWTTLNEPWCSSYLSYIGGIHAPGLMDRAQGVAAGHNLLLAHGLAAEAIKAADSGAVVGITVNLTHADPADPDSPADVAAAAKHDAFSNRAFIDPLMFGAYPQDVRDWLGDDLASVVKEGDLKIIATPIDVLGVNYYSGSCIGATPQQMGAGFNRPDGQRLDFEVNPRRIAAPTPDPTGYYHHARDLPVTAMGWEVQAEGLTRLLKRLHDDYTGPRGTALYVTENGGAWFEEPATDGVVDDTATRLDYYDQHLRAVVDAIDQGVDVRGYFAWSLMDNFEWGHGYSKRFGIVHVDFDTQVRTPKASARWFAEVARTKTIPRRWQVVE